jgi:hypothetical protein
MNDVENLRFNVLRNALYHAARRQTFERWNRVFNFITIALGAAVVGDLLARFGIEQMWSGVAVTMIGAAQLVLDFSGAARDHQVLQRDYYNLLSDIERTLGPDEAKLAEWRGRMMRITGEEPPVRRAIDAKAYNDALDALGSFDSSERLAIPAIQRLLGNWLAFEGHHCRKLAELEPKRIGGQTFDHRRSLPEC